MQKKTKKENKRSHIEHFKLGNSNRYFVTEKAIIWKQPCETTEAPKIVKRQILKENRDI